MLMTVVDGTDMVFGRLASRIAKRLMLGEEVHLINAEKLVIVGKPSDITGKYAVRKSIKHKGKPEKSPKWPRLPHLLVKRMIRGMLPRESSRGRDALSRLRVYKGNPKNMKVDMKVDDAGFDGISKHVTIDELCRSLGYSG
jgi:large subunit ribosomal protein L13